MKGLRCNFLCERWAARSPEAGQPPGHRCALSSEPGLHCAVQFPLLQNGATPAHLAGRA